MRQSLSGRPLLLILGFCCLLTLGLLFYYLSGALIFGGRLASDYYRPQEPLCNAWYQEQVLHDHRSPEEQAASPLRIPTCEQALQHPRRIQMLPTEEGLQVRLVIPELPAASAIWLHVHGITDSYLNGMRFTDLARREGFQLLLLELQNHGGSDRHDQGSSWGCREKFDLLAALDYIQKTWPNQPVLLSGTSMGTMTITQAALTRPQAFQAVRGIIFESPLSNFDNLTSRVCGKNEGICTFLLKKVVPFFTRLRSHTDFQTCFLDAAPPTTIPTELWLSDEEFKTTEEIELASHMPAHSQVQVRIFPKGTHSAYYGYSPEAIEKALREFWQKVQQPSHFNHVP